MNVEKLQKYVEKKIGEPESVTGAEHNYICPFCDRDGDRHHLHINWSKGDHGVCICHGCLYQNGSALSFLRELHGGSLPRNLERAAMRKSLEGWEKKIRKTLQDDLTGTFALGLPDGFRRLPYRDDGKVGGKIWKYLSKDRGYDYRVVDRFGLGYVPDRRSEAYGCLVVPFYMYGTCVYWQGRRVFGHGPKYHNPAASFKKHIVFGYDQAAGRKRLFLGEGVFDGMAWGRGGLSTTGLVLQPQQVRAISLLDPQEIIVSFDAVKFDATKGRDTEDATDHAWTAAKLLKRELRGVRVGVLRLPSGDPDENKHRLRKLAKRRTTWMDSDPLEWAAKQIEELS